LQNKCRDRAKLEKIRASRDNLTTAPVDSSAMQARRLAKSAR
jgi:hypothetical protein